MSLRYFLKENRGNLKFVSAMFYRRFVDCHVANATLAPRNDNFDLETVLNKVEFVFR